MTDDNKVPIYSVPDLKNATDDAIAPIFTSLGYTEDHTLTDVRLGLGFFGTAIAAITFAADYKYGFDSTKTLVTVAVALYFLVNTALTVWVWKVQGGVVYSGHNGTKKVKIASKAKKYDPTYHIEVTIQDEKKAPIVRKDDAKFMAWFDEQGHLVRKPLEAFLTQAL
ncbi:hypothetical protein BJ508DRAFT_96214 [Ascobolus immersus RN42]|uniref:Signal peptidase complex subunit 2 n=1 Tax=Ascobolus immersus RN42 TaxID=1160509 RepID=A0A3N4INW2_ASCIM|nr:hypothetical protein BJ508DRAFT_96214 [Ascobolus immersus RN42]